MIASIAADLVNLAAPLGLLWLALIGVAAGKFYRREKREAWVATGLVIFIWLFGATFLPGSILASLEHPYAGVVLDRLPTVDAIVLLGGGTGPGRGDGNRIDLNESGDRLLTALAIARRGKAPLIIVGGGVTEDGDRQWLQSENARDWFLNETDVTNRVVALAACQNTYDEAVGAKELVDAESRHQILLVTSAFHMRRAAAVFRTQLPGVVVHEVPCDFQTLAGRYGKSSMTLIPKPDGFSKMSVYLHELVSWYYYRARGWINADSAKQKTPSFRQ